MLVDLSAEALAESESPKAGLSGPKFDAPELRASYPTALGRPWKYDGRVNDWPMSLEPIATPHASCTTLPSALARKANCAPA